MRMIRSSKVVTWCPGCTNFLILDSFEKCLEEMEREGKINLRNVVIVCGIGCHGKIFDYLNLSGVNALHGRALPLALGIKLANRNLKVVCFVGDGDLYCEGMEHLIHTARYNPDIKVFVHNNQTFALTVGQSTSTSQKGFKSKVRPEGERLEPIDPILLSLSSNVSFVAREYVMERENLIKTMKEALGHRGFALVDILQPCISFNDFRNSLVGRIVRMEKSFEERDRAIGEYLKISKEGKIVTGIIYKKEVPTFEEIENVDKVYSHMKRKYKLKTLFEDFIV